MKIEKRLVSELAHDPNNARTHDLKNIEAIKGSLAKFGQQKPIVIDASNVVIAGNGTLEAARALGWETIDVVVTTLDSFEKTAFALADNQTATLADWDQDVLDSQLKALTEMDFDISDIGFDPIELDKELAEPSEKDDEVPELDDDNPYGVKLGDIWQLGEHRVMCADSTSKDNVDKLMDGQKADMVFTDPPYGVAVENTQGSIKNDHNLNCFIKCLPVLKETAKTDAHFYVWCASGDKLPESIWQFSKIIPFQNLLPIRCTHENKRGPKSAFKLNYETCLFGNDNTKEFNNTKKIKVSSTTVKDHRYTGDGYLSVYPALWDEQRSTEHNMNIVHPTQKNVEMVEFYIEISSDNGDRILDSFLGSGTTLIACEKTKRKCFGMEIDPHYVSVIIKRWEDFTGQKAVKL